MGNDLYTGGGGVFSSAFHMPAEFSSTRRSPQVQSQLSKTLMAFLVFVLGGNEAFPPVAHHSVSAPQLLNEGGGGVRNSSTVAN